jgi:hypothetical protein
MAASLEDRSGRQRFPTWLGLGFGLAAALCMPAPAAEIEDDKGTLEQAREEAQEARSLGDRFEVGVYPNAEFTPGMHFGEFDASGYQPGARVRVTMPVAPTAALRLIVKGSALLTDFSNVSQNLFDPGGPKTSEDPWGNLYTTSFQLQGGWRSPWKGLFSDRETWMLVGETLLRSRWEEGSSFGRGVDGGCALGVGYQLGDTLEVMIGAGIHSHRFSGAIEPYPVVEISWSFAPGWELRQRGRGGEIAYEIDEDVTVFVSGQYATRSYVLAERPGIGEGRLKDSSSPVALGVRWDVHPGVELTLSAGALVQHEIEVENGGQQSLGSVSSGPSPFLSFQVELRPDRIARGRATADGDQGAPGVGSLSSWTSRSR